MKDSQTLDTSSNIVVSAKIKIDKLNATAWSETSVDADNAIYLASQAKELSQTGLFAQESYERGLAESVRTIARAYVSLGTYDEALSLALETLNIAQQNNFTDLLPSIYFVMGVCYVYFGNISEGIDAYQHQVDISERIKDKEGIATALNGLGYVYVTRSEYKEALSYFERSLALSKELERYYYVALALNNQCFVYSRLGDYQQALNCGLESLAICQSKHITRVGVLALTSLTEVYIELNELEEALLYQSRAIKAAQKNGFTDLQIEAYRLGGTISEQQGNTDEAITSLEKAVELAQEINHNLFIYEAHLALSKIYKEKNDFNQALTHFEQYHLVKEQYHAEESEKKLKNFETIQRLKTAQQEAELYATLYAEEQTRRLFAETMQEISTALTGTIELSKVLDTILEQLELLVAFDRASILLRRDDVMEFVALRGFSHNSEMMNQTIEVGTDSKRDAFLRIYETQAPLVLNEDMDMYDSWSQIPDLTRPKAWLGLPLIYENQVQGMVSVVRNDPIPFDQESVTVGMTFAAQAAIALENASLYDQTVRFNEHLESEVEKRTHDLQEAYAQLERLDRTKGDFIAVTAHELRTPITVIKAYSQLLQSQLQDRDDSVEQIISGIASGAVRMHEIVNTMLVMVKIDSRELEIFPEPLHLEEMIQEIVTELTDDLQERKLTLVVDATLSTLPEFEGDKDALKMTFNHIIVNAIKYTPDGGEIHIHGRFWEEQPQQDGPERGVEIIISDTGIGIAPEALELIFTKFYQTGNVSLHSSGRTKFKGGGPGLGLAIARGIINAHNGRLWAESEGCDEETCPGSHFHIVLPC